MCNLYSMTKGQQAIREFTRATINRTGNLPPLPDGALRVVARGERMDTGPTAGPPSLLARPRRLTE